MSSNDGRNLVNMLREGTVPSAPVPIADYRHPEDPTIAVVPNPRITLFVELTVAQAAALSVEAERRGVTREQALIDCTWERLEIQPVVFPQSDPRHISLNARCLLAFTRTAIAGRRDGGHTYLTNAELQRRIQTHRGLPVRADMIREVVFQLLNSGLVAPARVERPKRGPVPLGWRTTSKGVDHLSACGYYFNLAEVLGL